MFLSCAAEKSLVRAAADAVEGQLLEYAASDGGQAWDAAYCAAQQKQIQCYWCLQGFWSSAEQSVSQAAGLNALSVDSPCYEVDTMQGSTCYIRRWVCRHAIGNFWAMLRVRHLPVNRSSVCCRDMYALVSAHTVQCDPESIIKTTTLSIKRYYTHAAEAHFHAI